MKKAIITGASNGLGKELGLKLQTQGYEVINISRSKSDFTDIPFDFTNPDLSELLDTIKTNHSSFDLLILNAGVMKKELTGNITQDINQAFDINVISAIKLTNALTALIKQNSADIVVVGSKASFEGKELLPVYSATKHAILGFTKSLQNQFRSTDSRVIGFHPGGFFSGIRGDVSNDGYMNPKDLAQLVIDILKLPKNIEVSEIIINRKK